MNKFGYSVRWKKFDGTLTEVGVSDCPDIETAKKEAFMLAKESGWTPRKWWQWWRWNENAQYCVQRNTFGEWLAWTLWCVVTTLFILFILNGVR